MTPFTPGCCSAKKYSNIMKFTLISTVKGDWLITTGVSATTHVSSSAAVFWRVVAVTF